MGDFHDLPHRYDVNLQQWVMDWILIFCQDPHPCQHTAMLRLMCIKSILAFQEGPVVGCVHDVQQGEKGNGTCRIAAIEIATCADSD
ncbi:MAG: hypothetical protein U0694_00480 [Anaerolineae bacterium]